VTEKASMRRGDERAKAMVDRCLGEY